jgi:ferrochelatase
VSTRRRAILWQSFGSPDKPDDIEPFLANVTRGRDIPEDRLRLVADQYRATGGASPLNALNRDLIHRLGVALAELGIEVPIYFGNRNWHPFLCDTVDEMQRDRIDEALVIPTSAYSSYSGCRQYREDLAHCRPAFHTHTIKPFASHPLFIAAESAIVRDFLAVHAPIDPGTTSVFATAHSIPTAMASTCEYEEQLTRVCQALQELLPDGPTIQLVYQSRSGSPRTPWLAPDVTDAIREAAHTTAALRRVIVIPIGFVSDHQEVRYDLDILARNAAIEYGLSFDRLATVGTSPTFIAMLADLVSAWVNGEDPNAHIPGANARCHDDCCLAGSNERRPT